VGDLWGELGTTMRAVRQGAGRSLRQVERESGWGRGTLSQIETGKGRPSRAQVEWYDRNLGGDGLLISIYAEARGAHRTEVSREVERAGEAIVDGDAFAIRRSLRALGEAAQVGTQLEVGWTLGNTGEVDWRGRCLTRVGAPSAPRLITSAPSVPLADCAPGDEIEVSLDVVIPALPGTLAAYWQITDSAGRLSFAGPALIPLIVTAV
jgi:transcriptional regulator with XRE-family HTH domain